MSLKQTHEVKHLESRLAKAQADLAAAKEDQAQANRRVCDAGKLIRDLTSRLAALQSSAEPVVSEHALLRYIERVVGVDLDAAKAEILSTVARKAIQDFPTCTIQADGFKLVVRNRTVVTVET